MESKITFLKWSMKKSDFVNMVLTQVGLIWMICLVGTILPTGIYHNTFVTFLEGLAIVFILLLLYKNMVLNKREDG
jgi:hypothetical protein